jgi:hypothetical protein
VVDPGFGVDPVHSCTPNQPQDPDQPQKMADKNDKTGIDPA